uniref:KH_dom_type_1 domain-containing protein n=1 Tax=Globodera pallida TaxID=36090 RepID=A0A183BJ37_GLOPA
MANIDEDRDKNFKKIRRIDTSAVKVIEYCDQASVFSFVDGQWKKTGIQNVPLFLYEKVVGARYALLVGLPPEESFTLEITQEIQVQHDPSNNIFIKNVEQGILRVRGVGINDKDCCKKVFNAIVQLLNEQRSSQCTMVKIHNSSSGIDATEEQSIDRSQLKHEVVIVSLVQDEQQKQQQQHMAAAASTKSRLEKRQSAGGGRRGGTRAMPKFLHALCCCLRPKAYNKKYDSSSGVDYPDVRGGGGAAVGSSSSSPITQVAVGGGKQFQQQQSSAAASRAAASNTTKILQQQQQLRERGDRSRLLQKKTPQRWHGDENERDELPCGDAIGSRAHILFVQ